MADDICEDRKQAVRLAALLHDADDSGTLSLSTISSHNSCYSLLTGKLFGKKGEARPILQWHGICANHRSRNVPRRAQKMRRGLCSKRTQKSLWLGMQSAWLCDWNLWTPYLSFFDSVPFLLLDQVNLQKHYKPTAFETKDWVCIMSLGRAESVQTFQRQICQQMSLSLPSVWLIQYYQY